MQPQPQTPTPSAGMPEGESHAAEQRTARFWTSLPAEDRQGMIFDADGNDRTPLIRGLVAHLDALSEEVGRLADRVKALESGAAVDEARLAAEIELLRARRG